TVCGGGLVCAGGMCGLSCPGGRANCDSDLTNGCETALNENGSCGTDCYTRRDCGGWGDTCEGSGNTRHCRCDNGDHCRPGEYCAGVFDDCECAGGVACSGSEVCCNLSGGRQCIDIMADA